MVKVETELEGNIIKYYESNTRQKLLIDFNKNRSDNFYELSWKVIPLNNQFLNNVLNELMKLNICRIYINYMKNRSIVSLKLVIDESLIVLYNSSQNILSIVGDFKHFKNIVSIFIPELDVDSRVFVKVGDYIYKRDFDGILIKRS